VCEVPGARHPRVIGIRAETAGDIARVREVVQAAFANHPHSDGSEPRIVDALRAAGALTIALVAVRDAIVVGHIAFSPVQIAGGSHGWFGLGPVAVVPELQHAGIGSALIRAGLDVLKQRGAAGCVLVGEPAYYERFGFRHDPRLVYEGVPPEVFLALSLDTARPATGTVTYHAAFTA
jgi:putative acetyltransferase